MQKNQEAEEQYLELTLKKLQEQIKETNIKLQKIPSMYKNERLIENLTKQYANKLIFLEKTKDKPYFARIDFKNANDPNEEELYIGKTNITDEDNTEYKLEAYILSGEIIFIIKSNNFVLKCKKYTFDTFFNNLDGFEKQLLTLDTKPLYKNSFLTPIEGDLTYKYVYRDYVWPSIKTEFTVGDKKYEYGIIDISSQTYFKYF